MSYDPYGNQGFDVPVTGTPYPYQQQPQYYGPRPTNGMAIASLVTSIAAFVLCGGILGVVGAILGHVARKKIRETGEEGEGLALAGIIVGWIGFAIGLLVIAFYVVVIVWAINAPRHSYDYNGY